LNTIYKFHVAGKDQQIVHIKGFRKLLTVEEQYNSIVLYAEVDTENEDITEIPIRVAGTGHSLDGIGDNYRYLGTVKIMEGRLVFHVYADTSRIEMG